MKSAITLLLALATSASLSAQVFLTSFGTNDFDDFNDFLDSQTASSGSFSSDDLSGALFWGDFLNGSIDITGYTDALALTATVFDNPATSFWIYLVDSDEHTYEYEGAWADFVTGEETTVILSAAANQTGEFHFAEVTGLDFVFGSYSTSDTLNVTFSGLSAMAPVPEPAAFAAFAGLAVLGYGVVRRRR